MGVCASRPIIVSTESPGCTKAKLDGLQTCTAHGNSGNEQSVCDDGHDWTPRDESVRFGGLPLKSKAKAERVAGALVDGPPSAAAADSKIEQQPIVKMVENMLGQPYDLFGRGPPIPPCNSARAQAVKNLQVVDGIPVPAIDHIVTLICQVFRVEAALVALFDDNRIFVSNARSFQRGDFPWKWSFCAWSLTPPQPEVLLIEDVAEDARFADNQVAQSLGIKFYCGSPILGGNRHRLGTLCFVDSKPRNFGAEQLMILANLAEMVGRELERGAALHAQAKSQRAFMSRALECFTTAVAFVDVCAPGWRIMHSSPSFAQAAGLSPDEVANVLLWDLLEAPPAGFDVIVAAAEIAAAGNEFVLGGIVVKNRAEHGVFDLRLRSAGSDVLDEHTSPIGIPAHVSSRPDEAQQYLFVTLTASRDSSATTDIGLPPADGSATTSATSSAHRSRSSSMKSMESAFFVDRGSAPSSVPFEGLHLGPLVGCGSYGRVYRGVYQDTTVAVKICQPRGRRRVATAEGAWSTVEARARQLAHPHIVRLLRHCTVLTPVHGSSSRKAGATSDKHAPVARLQGLTQQMAALGNGQPAAHPGVVPALTTDQARRMAAGSPFDSTRSIGASIPSASSAHSSLASAPPRVVNEARDVHGRKLTAPAVATDKTPSSSSMYLHPLLLTQSNGSEISAASPGPAGSVASTSNGTTANSSPHTSSESGAAASVKFSSGSPYFSSASPGKEFPGWAAQGQDGKRRLNVSPLSLAPSKVQGSSFAMAGDAIGMSAFSGGGGASCFNKQPQPEQSPHNPSSASGSSSEGSSGTTVNSTTASSSLHLSSTPSQATTSNVGQVMTPGSNGPRKAAAAGEVETWQLMEYCDRGSLQGAIDKGWFRKERTTRVVEGNVDVILSVAAEVCSAMAYLHKEGVVHGDLTSGNVLLKSQSSSPHGFTAKVADFGLARVLALNSPQEANNSYGTVTHMPPEVLNGEAFQRPADVWSFGVLLWEMWCGVRAWAGCTRPQTMLAIAINLQPLVFPATTPPDFQALAASCMSTDPAARPSFDQLQDALRTMADANQ